MRTLVIEIETIKNDVFNIDIFDSETGDVVHKEIDYSPSVHPEFDNWIGSQLYGWAEMEQETYMDKKQNELLEKGLTQEKYDELMFLWNDDIDAVYSVVDDYGVDICNRGYEIFDYDGTRLLNIEAVVDVSTLDDREAARKAEKDGFCKIIPPEELPTNFDLRFFGWVDTPENRKAIEEYCKDFKNYYCCGNSGRRIYEPSDPKNHTTTVADALKENIVVQLYDTGTGDEVFYGSLYELLTNKEQFTREATDIAIDGKEWGDTTPSRITMYVGY